MNRFKVDTNNVGIEIGMCPYPWKKAIISSGYDYHYLVFRGIKDKVPVSWEAIKEYVAGGNRDPFLERTSLVRFCNIALKHSQYIEFKDVSQCIQTRP